MTKANLIYGRHRFSMLGNFSSIRNVFLAFLKGSTRSIHDEFKSPRQSVIYSTQFFSRAIRILFPKSNFFFFYVFDNDYLENNSPRPSAVSKPILADQFPSVTRPSEKNISETGLYIVFFFLDCLFLSSSSFFSVAKLIIKYQYPASPRSRCVIRCHIFNTNFVHKKHFRLQHEAREVISRILKRVITA